MSWRVLHVLDHSWPVLDGYAQRSRSIVTAQSQLGMHPCVVTGPLHDVDDASSLDAVVDGIPYVRAHAGGALLTNAINRRWPIARELAIVHRLRRKIENLLEQESFDLVHAHSPALCGLAALQACRRRQTPLVYEIRSFWEDSDLAREKSLFKLFRYHSIRKLETFVGRHANAVVGIAQAILEDLKSRGIPEAKMYHVPNGVDAERFKPLNRDSSLAAQLGLNGIPTIGYLGTLFPWEGVSWLINAATELRRNGRKFNLLIVGDGAEGDEVRKKILQTASASYIHFVGRVPNDQVERYYSVMDVLVYPRRSTRITEFVTPLKPLEAMALGKAILASGVGGIRELIRTEKTGLLFEPEDIEDFCQKATRLLDEPQLRYGLGESARQQVSQEKDWKTIALAYEKIYAAASRNVRTPS
jgi:glycogen(starch) synthase